MSVKAKKILWKYDTLVHFSLSVTRCENYGGIHTMSELWEELDQL